MMEKITNFQLTFFLFCFFLLSNCKSENKKIESNKMETIQAEVLGMNKDSTSMESIQKEREEVDNNVLSGIDSPSVTSIPKDVIKKERKKEVIQKKKVETPIQTNPKIATEQNILVNNTVISYKKPQIQFEELTWDFGEITEGDIIEKKFKFTNTGDAPLQIIATRATCGCTRPTFPFLDIAPGESKEIGVNYNSVGKDGEQNPEVTIESNTHPKITVLKLHGTVIPKKVERIDSTTTSDTLNTKM